MDIHYAQVVMMLVGVSFIIFAILIYRYNMKRKAKRVNQKTPSGGLFILTLALTGMGIIYYGYVMEVNEADSIIAEDSVGTLDDLANETPAPKSSGGGFLEAVSESAK